MPFILAKLANTIVRTDCGPRKTRRKPAADHTVCLCPLLRGCHVPQAFMTPRPACLVVKVLEMSSAHTPLFPRPLFFLALYFLALQSRGGRGLQPGPSHIVVAQFLLFVPSFGKAALSVSSDPAPAREERTLLPVCRISSSDECPLRSLLRGGRAVHVAVRVCGGIELANTRLDAVPHLAGLGRGALVAHG